MPFPRRRVCLLVGGAWCAFAHRFAPFPTVLLPPGVPSLGRNWWGEGGELLLWLTRLSVRGPIRPGCGAVYARWPSGHLLSLHPVRLVRTASGWVQLLAGCLGSPGGGCSWVMPGLHGWPASGAWLRCLLQAAPGCAACGGHHLIHRKPTRCPPRRGESPRREGEEQEEQEH